LLDEPPLLDDERPVSDGGLYGAEVLGVDALLDPYELADVGVPVVGNVEGRAGALVGRACGAAWGRKLDAPDRGAGLGEGVTVVGLDVVAGGFVSSGLATGGDTGAVADFDVELVGVAEEAEGVEKLDAPGRVVEEPDDEPEDDEGVGRNGVTGAGAGGRVPGRAAPGDDPEDDDPLDGVDLLSDGASSFAETLDTVGLEDPGRAGVVRALDDPSLSLASSLGSPDFTSEALTVIGDAPPPGIGRDVLSGR
jgi:hypothetical protein